MGRDKVVFVDFNPRRPGTGARGSKLVFGVFLTAVLGEIVAAAAFFPASIGTPLFGPLVVVVAVVAAFGAERVSRGATRFGGRGGSGARGGDAGGFGSHGRTLH